jgi:hypothetical protein
MNSGAQKQTGPSGGSFYRESHSAHPGGRLVDIHEMALGVARRYAVRDDAEDRLKRRGE